MKTAREILIPVVGHAADAVVEALDAAGYVIVPKKETDEMRHAGWEFISVNHVYDDIAEIWSAMLAARPK